MNSLSKVEEKDLRYYLEEALYDSRPLTEGKTLPRFADHTASRGTVVLTHSFIGAPDDLGFELMEAFIISLNSLKEPPKYIVFMHEAVKMCTEGNPCLPALQLLQKKGCSLRICERSAKALDIMDSVKTGHFVSANLIMKICLNSEKTIQF